MVRDLNLFSCLFEDLACVKPVLANRSLSYGFKR